MRARLPALPGGALRPPGGAFQPVVRALLLAGFLLPAGPAPFASGQERAEAIVDLNPIGIEDELVLTVSVPGDGANRMELPVLEDFDIGGSGRTFRTSLVNGRMQQTVEWNFTLRPRRTGDLRIPPVPVPGFPATEEIVVRVEDGSLRPRRPRRDPFGSLFGVPFDPFDPFDRRALSARPPADVGEGEVFVLAETPGFAGGDSEAPEVHVGEQVLVLYRLYSRLPVAAAGAVEMTDAEGFWTEEVTLPDVPWQEQGLDRSELARRRALPGPRRERRTVGGVAYETWPVLLRAVFPTGAGERELPGPRFQVRVQSPRTSFFGPDRVTILRDAPSLTIRALEIPAAGRPAGWAGAVGDYELRAEILREGEPLDGAPASVGEPLVLRLELAGAGNLRAAGTPALPDTPEFRRAFRAFDPDLSTEVGLGAAGGEYFFGGRRLWEFPLVPEAGGVRRIPEIALDAFDPRAGRYERLATDALELTVEGASAAAPGAAGPASVERFGEDIRYLKPVTAVGPAAPPWRPGAGFFLLLALPFAWNGLVFFHRRRRAYRSRHAARFRRQGAARTALGALGRVEGDGTDAAAAVAGILTGYAADRFSVSARGLTPSAAAARLVEAGAAPGTARRFAALLSRSESARYAAGPVAPAGPVGPEASSTDSPAGEAAKLIRSLEDEISAKAREPGGGSGARRAAGTAALLAFVFAPGFGAAPEAALADPEEAARRYDAGDYREAAGIWRAMLGDAGAGSGGAAGPGEGPGAGRDRAALHYNLGNAEFRDGRLGYAMLHWERSLRLRPGDPEARANLALARSLLDRRLTAAAASAEGEGAPGSGVASADAFALELLGSMEGFTAGARRVPPGRFGAALVAAALLGGALTTLLLFRVGPRRLLGTALAAAVLSAGVSAFLLRLALTAPPLAVVVRPAAALRSGPGPSFPQLASLPEGLYVEVGEGEAAAADGDGRDGYLRVVAAGIVGFAAREEVIPVAVSPAVAAAPDAPPAAEVSRR